MKVRSSANACLGRSCEQTIRQMEAVRIECYTEIGRNWEEKMKTNKILMIAIILLIATNFLTYSKVGRLEDELSRVNNTLYRMSDRIEDISGDVSRQLYEFKLENAWTRKAGAEAVSYNEKDQTAGVKVEVEFNELGKDERVFIVVQDSQGSIVKKTDVSNKMDDSLNLVTYLDLALGVDYTLSIVAESNEAKRSQDLGTVRLANVMQEVLYVDGHSWEIQFDEYGNYKSASMDIMLHTNFSKKPFIADYFENRELVGFMGEVYVEDRLMDTIDFALEEWQISGDYKQSNTTENKSQLPKLRLGSDEDSFWDINGTYTFDEPVEANRQVEVHVVLTDNQGEAYRYVLPYMFE